MLSNTKVAEESASKAYAEAMHEMDVDKAMKDADIKSRAAASESAQKRSKDSSEHCTKRYL